MGDYTKTAWVEGVTQTGPTNLNKLEQGVADATKQASMDTGAAFDGTTATANDKKRITWRRTSDGSYVASVENFETGAGGTLTTVLQDRVAQGVAGSNTLTAGAKARRILEAYQRDGNPIVTGIARLVIEAIRGGGGNVRVEMKSEGGLDPTYLAYLLDDSGYSDWARVLHGTLANRPAATAATQNQIYVTTTGQVFINLDGSSWTQIAGTPETIVTPANGGFSNSYINYLSSFRYWKIDGYVHVTGEINTGASSPLTANTLIFNFPAGYRPTSRIYVRANGNPGTNRFIITTAGDLRIDDNAANSTVYSNFGHFTFPTF